MQYSPVMRIAAGRYRGRILFYPRSGLRPTKDITRQAIFNMLQGSVKGARVCDLYAGGGSLGIEALSRGADEVVFVEESAGVFKFLRENVRGIAGAKVVRGDVLEAAARIGTGFDLALCDPPYCRGLVRLTLEAVEKNGVVRPGGLVVIEHHRMEQPEPSIGWTLVKQGRYGDSWVSIIRRNE